MNEGHLSTELFLGARSLSLDDPGDGAVVAGGDQLSYDAPPSAPVPPATSTAMSGADARGDFTGVEAIPSESRSTVAAAMEQPSLTPTKSFVRDLADGQDVDAVFLVRSHSRRQKRNGEPFLKLQLEDQTGAVEAVVWDGVDECSALCPAAAVVRWSGVTRSTTATAPA